MRTTKFAYCVSYLFIVVKETIITMKCSVCVCGLALSPVVAFLGPLHHQAHVQVLRSEAQDHLEQLAEKWSELKTKEQELLGKHDPVAAMDLAVEMLETALEQVHTKEEVEDEHVASVQDALRRVLKIEDVWGGVANLAHHDAEDADGILHTYATELFGEDREKRRELAVTDLAHHMEDYAGERLHQAEEEELHIREEEGEAKNELEQLKWNEELLKATLDELKAIKREQEKTQQKW